MPTPRHALAVLPLLLLAVFHLSAQVPLQECTGWMASVDPESQRIVLSWNQNSDQRVAGYHLCSGQPCLDYDTLHSRQDTTYTCFDHSPLEAHTYRLHAFDSLLQPSALTPPFGNIVLTAEVPTCASEVHTHWTPYPSEGIGHVQYALQGMMTPLDSTFSTLYTADDTAQLHFSFQLPDGAQGCHLRVVASIDNGKASYSNRIFAPRNTIDTAQRMEIIRAEYDSVHTTVRVELGVDPRFDYVLYRSVDGTAWRKVADVHPTSSVLTVVDRDINPFDSLHCYQLEAHDACGLHPRYSETACLVVPNPPEPQWFFPNIVLLGDERNGTFLPAMQGLRGDLYELFIYNRMGLLVFHTTDDHLGWTPPLDTPQGTYTYTLRCRFNNYRIRLFRGTITVIK